MTKFPYDIFISYSQKDRTATERLQAAFEAHRLKVWRDERLAENPEKDFIGSINEALERSAKVVVLWSRHSVQSTWVRAEAEKARMAEKVVPLALEPIGALLPFIPTPFNILPTIDVSAATFDLAPILRALGAEQVEGQPEGVLSLVRAEVDISKLPDTYANKLYGRDREMADLIAAWDGGITRIFAFDAMGGAGKTALVYHFVQALKASGWRGARSIFAWSFYSQGSNEDRQTSADDFFKAAFNHFSGGTKKPPRDPREKGVHLAHLLQQHRCLLILDGLEPLQCAAAFRCGGELLVGGIKDPGVRALLSLLSDNNLGLCIVTTRIRLAELVGAKGVTFEGLDEIPLMDAIDLLRDLGIVPDMPPAKFKLPAARDFAALTPPYRLPTAYTPREVDHRATIPALIAKDFVEAVKELKGHALALTLVARYLAEHHGGDIRAIRDLPDLAHLDPATKERAPYRVMRAIEIALANRVAEQDASEKPAEVAEGRQLALLFFLGLFDRPAERELLPVVFGEAPADLAPNQADIELAATDLIVIERQLWELEEELHNGAPEWRRKEIERYKRPLAAKRKEAIEARRRILVRRLFAGMHAHVGDEASITNPLSQLAAQGLVSRADNEARNRASIDCHPLVREYFGARLKELDDATFRTAHGRLYDQYRYANLPTAFHDPVAYGVLVLAAESPDAPYKEALEALAKQPPTELLLNLPPSLLRATPEQLRKSAALIGGRDWERALSAFLPEDEAGMTPLFAAVCHGCAAEREEETWSEVYWPRIARGNDLFANRKLRLFGQELAALAGFFEMPFDKPSPRLSPRLRATLFSVTGFCLRPLGRLNGAAKSMHAAFLKFKQLQIWREAALNASHVSQLRLYTGNLWGENGAVAVAEEAVAFAERSGEEYLHVTRCVVHADALMQAGRIAHAESRFREARMLAKHPPPLVSRLYSAQGYHHCDLLIARGRPYEAAKSAAVNRKLFERVSNLLVRSLDDLSQARATLASKVFSTAPAQEYAVCSAEALADLRRANNEPELPRGLLTHAEVLWRCGDVDAAGELLREAETIAKRGPMPLYMAQVHLLAARMQLTAKRTARARFHRIDAAVLIEKHRYGRGVVELAILDAEIACAENAANHETTLAAAIKAIRGEPYYDERTDITIDGGWWGLLPRLEALIPEDHPELLSLRAARDAYNSQRDAYLADFGYPCQ